MNRIYIVPPPGFKGRNELYIAQHLATHVRGAELLAPLEESDKSPGSGFYHTGAWVDHQMRMLRILQDRLHEFTDGDQFVFTDFWFPGLDLFKLLLEDKGIKPTLIGYLHGASFVDGDLIRSPWVPPLEESWIQMYDVIWAASKFFVRNMPAPGRHKIRIVGEPFDPLPLLAYRDPFDKAFDVVYPHRLAADKGFDELLQILPHLHGLRVLVTAAFDPDPAYLTALGPYVLDGTVTLRVGEDEDAHLKSLASCRVVLSTAVQEGWGYAVLKAVSVGCVPVLPNRAVYPELYARRYLYDSVCEAVGLIHKAVKGYPEGSFVPPAFVVGGGLRRGILTR